MSALLWALLALPLVAGAALAVAGHRADRVAPGLAVAVAAAGCGLAAGAAYVRPVAGAPLLAGAPARFAVDGLSGLVAVAVTAVTTAVLAFAAADPGLREARARFHGLMLLFSGAMVATVTATTLPVLLMGWEVMGATSWALIGFWWRDADRVPAANLAFLTTRAADLGLYLAAGAALAGAGPGRPAPLALDGPDGLPGLTGPWLSVVTAGLLAAAFGKSAQLPFSFWLARAMRGPSPVSALLHSAAMVVAGAYLLLRMGPLLAASGWGGAAVAWTGAVTALALGLVAVTQTDLKQLLAASSCAQIGFMVLAAGVGATTGGTLQLLAHAAAKSLAFLVAGAWLTVLGTEALPALRGAARRFRVPGVTFTVAALALAGLPPLSLWAAKDLLLAGAREAGPGLYAVGLAAAAVSAAYSGKALWYVWRPAPGTAPSGRPAPPRYAALPLCVLALACAGLAALALPPVRTALDRTLDLGPQPGPAAWELVLSGVLAVAASSAAWAWGDRVLSLPRALRGPFVRWLCLEEAARACLVRPVLRLAHALAAFDARVLTRGTEAAARGTSRVAWFAAQGPERALDGAVAGIAAGCRTLGHWARRPQTGQLHQYLAQAVAAVTLLAVVCTLAR
ncbi:proton-conducting transporter membrane subunit [Streptomyces sp. NPDC003077]|uniref:proton-conducting transporter transmembrane domain-containing protein n=1 Tax=Streptomyces sp. NPDC003077 TaxID=3154443 RepID=UPI0033ABC45F